MQAVKRHRFNTEFENPLNKWQEGEGTRRRLKPDHTTQLRLPYKSLPQSRRQRCRPLISLHITFLTYPDLSLGNPRNRTSWVCINSPTDQSSIRATFSLQDVAASKAREALQEFPLVSSFKGLQSGRLKTSTEKNLACGLLSQKGAEIQGGRRSLRHDLGFI